MRLGPIQRARNCRDFGEGGGVAAYGQEGGSSGRVTIGQKGLEIDGRGAMTSGNFLLRGNILSKIKGWVV